MRTKGKIVVVARGMAVSISNLNCNCFKRISLILVTVPVEEMGNRKGRYSMTRRQYDNRKDNKNLVSFHLDEAKLVSCPRNMNR